MARVRVVVSMRSRFFREILGQFLELQPGIEVVGKVRHARRILAEVLRTGASVILVPLVPSPADGIPREYEDLLAECPKLLIVALSQEGNPAVVYRRVAQANRIGEMSTDLMLDIIRSAELDD